MSAPKHLRLDELIDRLAEEDPTRQVPLGFAEAHSYRGYYHEVAFEAETGRDNR